MSLPARTEREWSVKLMPGCGHEVDPDVNGWHRCWCGNRAKDPYWQPVVPASERARADALQAVIEKAYDAAMEFKDDPQAALTCVVEWLEDAIL